MTVLVRIEIRFIAANDGWTPDSFDAFTDRLADAFPDLEAAHPWLIDLDLAAALDTGTLAVGLSADDPSAHPYIPTVVEAVLAQQGDVDLEFYQVCMAMDSGTPPTPWLAPEGAVQLEP